MFINATAWERIDARLLSKAAFLCDDQRIPRSGEVSARLSDGRATCRVPRCRAKPYQPLSPGPGITQHPHGAAACHCVEHSSRNADQRYTQGLDCEDAVATRHSRGSAAEIAAVLTQSQSAHASSSAAESTLLSLNWRRILCRIGATQFPTASIAEVSRKRFHPMPQATPKPRLKAVPKRRTQPTPKLKARA
jgi:hypothetical protein